MRKAKVKPVMPVPEKPSEAPYFVLYTVEGVYRYDEDRDEDILDYTNCWVMGIVRGEKARDAGIKDIKGKLRNDEDTHVYAERVDQLGEWKHTESIFRP